MCIQRSQPLLEHLPSGVSERSALLDFIYESRLHSKINKSPYLWAFSGVQVRLCFIVWPLKRHAAGRLDAIWCVELFYSGGSSDIIKQYEKPGYIIFMRYFINVNALSVPVYFSHIANNCVFQSVWTSKENMAGWNNHGVAELREFKRNYSHRPQAMSV